MLQQLPTVVTRPSFDRMTPNDRSPDDEPVLPVAQAAKARGLPPRRVRSAIRNGELRAFVIGSWWRVRLRDLDNWIENHRYKPKGERPLSEK